MTLTPSVSRLLAFASVAALAGCGNTVTGSSGARACITAAACASSIGGVSQCTASIAGVNNSTFAAAAHINAAQVNCLAGAGNNCDAARRCLNGGMEPQPCTGGSASCSGNLYNFCGTLTGSNGQEATQQFDCASVGEMCVGSGGNIDCGLGTCSGAASSCVGNQLQSCQNGILHQFDCAPYGATCVSTIGISHCRGSGAACTAGNPLDPLAPVRCDGATLVVCADGQEARFDCGQLQEGCFPNVNGRAFGCALGGDCDPNNFSATCVGTKLDFCNNGKRATYDCASLGFHGCDPQNGGRCTP